jgi:hypothetical protein
MLLFSCTPFLPAPHFVSLPREVKCSCLIIIISS